MINRIFRFKHSLKFSKIRNISSKTNTSGLYPFPLADIGEGITEVEVIQWFVTPGASVNEFDKICEVMSDKANVEITSPHNAIVKELHCDVGNMAKVGDPLVTLQLKSRVKPVASASIDIGSESPTTPINVKKGKNTEKKKLAKKIQATPAVRRIAKDKNIDISLVTATGPGGRILKEDMLNYLNSSLDSSSHPPANNLKIPSENKSIDKVIPIVGIQRFMVKKMDQVAKIACFGYGDDVKMDRLMEVRNQLKPLAKKHNIKLSYMPFILKATSLSLLEFPQLNGHVNSDCTEVIQRGEHNIGIAVDSKQGLIVPNIKNVEDKSILQIAQEMNELIARVRNQCTTAEDIKGGTLTLSNVGNIGGTICRPVLFSPELLICALGKSQKLPVYENEKLVGRFILHSQWTADHRILDGATIARFCNTWKTYLEEPDIMLLSLK